MKKALYFIYLASFAQASNTLLALRQGGILENSGNAIHKALSDAGHARPQVCSYDPVNPASMSFCNQVGFNTSLSLEDFKSEGANTIAADQLSLRSFGLLFPTRWFSMGFAYEQLSPRTIRISQDSLDWNLYGGRSQMSLGLSFPLIYNTLSLGFKGGLNAGSTREDLVLYSVKAQPTQSWKRKMTDDYNGYLASGTLNYKSTEFASYMGVQWNSAWEAKRQSTLNQYTKDSTKNIEGNFGTGSFPDVNLVQNADTLESSLDFNLGLNYALASLHQIDLDLRWSTAANRFPVLKDPNSLDRTSKRLNDQNPWGLSVGYTFGNSDRPFDAFYKKMALRTGLGIQSLGFEDAMEYKGSLGVGSPMGMRGSRLDISMDAGVRKASQYQDEKFIGLWFTLSGFGNWGQPSRKYR